MQIDFLGGAGEVGASCIWVSLAGKNMVLDCGMRMGQAKDAMPDLNKIQENGGVEAIFLSHAHMDHSGHLPVLSEAYPQAPIYCTHVTKDLVRVLLYDSLKIMDQKEAEIPVFSERQVQSMLERMICFNPNYTFKPFNDQTIAVTFYSAGHIAGAVCMNMVSEEGSLLYTGDFAITRQSTVEGAALARLRPDVMICESTYGDRLHANREVEESRLIVTVGEVIAKGGKILIPAFALGRAQDIILILKKAMMKKQLPMLTLYVDGMVKDICRIYEDHPNYLRGMLSKKLLKGKPIFFDEVVKRVTSQAMREEIVSSKEACCILSSSGMMTGGPSQYYASKLMGDEKNFVAITGYQDEEAPGHKVVELIGNKAAGDACETLPTIELGIEKVKVAAQVGQYGLSAHADKSQIIAFIESLAPKHTFIVHGNAQVCLKLGREVQQSVYTKVFVPQNGESYTVKVEAPRKQLAKTQLPSLYEKDIFTQAEDEKLWLFILQNIGSKKTLVGEDLYWVWYGRVDFEEAEIRGLYKIIGQSPYFEAELKRPFVFHALEKDKVVLQKEEGTMEVNQMLKLVDTYFTQELGLYKKGARIEQTQALLFFTFPEKAKQIYEESIKAFERESGWAVVLNTDVNLAEAQSLIETLLNAQGITSSQVSYYKEQNLFKVKVLDASLLEGVKVSFKEKSGVELVFIDASSMVKEQKPVQKKADAMEQNQAFWYIDQSFATTAHKLYKRSIKNKEGRAVMELSFISPFVSTLYEKEIEELRKAIGWDITINQGVNQNELLLIAKRLLVEKGLVAQKLSYMPSEYAVKAKGIALTEEEAIMLDETYKALTGIHLLLN